MVQTQLPALSDQDQSRSNRYAFEVCVLHFKNIHLPIPNTINVRWVSGFMFGLGDIISQSAVEKRKIDEIDWLRTVRYASIGCAVGPSLSIWYRTLDGFGTKNTVPVLAKKLLVDQLIASPIVNGSVMIMSRVYSGDEWPKIQKKLEDNYVTVMLNSYLVKIL